MRGRILLIAGLGVGYVLGARAGRGAYDRLRQRADQVVHDPTVQRAARTAVQAAEKAAPELTGKVEGVVGAVATPAASGSTPPAAPRSTRPATIGEGTRATAPSGGDEAATATD